MRMYLGDSPGQQLNEAIDCIESWKSGEPFRLDTKKISLLSMEVTDADIIALFYALIERYQQIESREQKLRVCAEAMSRLAACLNPAISPPLGSNRPIAELGLSARTNKCLKNLNVRTVGELEQRTESELLKNKNFGRESLNEITDVLTSLGLHLKVEEGNNYVL